MTTQYWITGRSGDWSVAADWVSGVVPASTDGAVITNSNVTVNGTAVAYSLTLDNSSMSLSGTLTLGASLAVDDGAPLTLSGGTLSAQSISSNNSGYLYGYGTIGGAVSGNVWITADSGTLKVQGSLAGDQGRFTIDGGATLELSNGTTAALLFDGNSATLKLDAPTAFTAPIYQVVVGDAIDLVGITASSATYSGSTLTINETNGQHLTYNNVTGSLAGDIVTVASDNNGGTLVYWGTAPAATTQYWITGRSGDWSVAADWVSGVVPASTDGAVITNSNVTVNGTAVAYSLTLDNSSMSLSGTLTLGASLAVDDGAPLTLSGGTLSAQSISSNNSGYLCGYGTIGGAVSGNVWITADSGTLKVQGSLAGDQGRFTIDGGATLELSNGTTAALLFDGNSATLKLDAPTAFTAPIYQVVVGDAIDLVGITASSATYSGSTLTINETNGQHLTYNNVTGSLAGDIVTVASDNNGGTLVYWGTAPAATTQYWITGRSGDWSVAADWVSGVVPASTDGAVITNSNVTVNGTAVAYSLTLDNSSMSLSGTLTLGASLAVDDGAPLTLSGGTLSAQSISSNNSGYLYGYGTIGGAVSGNVWITADSGTLKVQGSLAGDQGRFTIDGGATLELSNGTTAALLFDGNSATLKLDAPTAFTAPIYQVVVGDAIDLVGITASSATYSGSTLTINETNGQHLTYNNVTGSLAGDIVTVASDNNGGTLVYWTSPAPVTPTVAVAINSTDLNLAHNTATVTFAFSEAPVDFSLADVTAPDGKLSSLSGSGTIYMATFTANAEVDDTNATVSVTDGIYHDAGGNAGTGGSTAPFSVDTVTPSVTVTTGNGDVNVAHNSATITFAFSEATTDFSLSDVTMIGGTLSNFGGSGTTYTATFTGAGNTDIINASVSVTAGSWHENNGNAGTGGSTGNFVVDTVMPTVPAVDLDVTAGATLSANAAHGVLAGASDPAASQPLSVVAVNGVSGNVGHSVAGAYGTLMLNADGSYSYAATASSASLPNGGAEDNFNFTVSDRNGNTVISTLSILVASASDTVYVGTAGGTVNAGNANSVIDGRAGNETIHAGNGADVIIGGPYDVITAGNGSDSVTAGANSSIKLGNGNDTVTGGANNTITIGNGNDTIYAGANDLINLGRGIDTVAFGESPNPIAIGNETINGFNPAHDIIQFNPVLLANYAAALVDTAQVGANTVIQIDAKDSLTLDHVTATALSATNFHFS